MKGIPSKNPFGKGVFVRGRKFQKSVENLRNNKTCDIFCSIHPIWSPGSRPFRTKNESLRHTCLFFWRGQVPGGFLLLHIYRPKQEGCLGANWMMGLNHPPLKLRPSDTFQLKQQHILYVFKLPKSWMVIWCWCCCFVFFSIESCCMLFIWVILRMNSFTYLTNFWTSLSFYH